MLHAFWLTFPVYSRKSAIFLFPAKILGFLVVLVQFSVQLSKLAAVRVYFHLPDFNRLFVVDETD